MEALQASALPLGHATIVNERKLISNRALDGQEKRINYAGCSLREVMLCES
jgi:hypothetical protein